MSDKTQDQTEEQHEVAEQQHPPVVAEQHPSVDHRPLKFHPYAEVFPLLRDTDPKAWSQFVADVRENGIIDPITLVKDVIVDGRNRYLAAVEAGVQITSLNSRQYLGGGDLLKLVVSRNLRRRHLDTSQRAMVATTLANMRQGERTDLEPSANLQKVSQEQAAALMNVSPRIVADAKVIADQSPELADRVAKGKLTVNAAKAELRPPTCAHGYPGASGACPECCKHGVPPHRCPECRNHVSYLSLVKPAPKQRRLPVQIVVPGSGLELEESDTTNDDETVEQQPDRVEDDKRPLDSARAKMPCGWVAEKFVAKRKGIIWHRYVDKWEGVPSGTIAAAVLDNGADTCHLEQFDVNLHRRSRRKGSKKDVVAMDRCPSLTPRELTEIAKALEKALDARAIAERP
jgi:hypothetical protein